MDDPVNTDLFSPNGGVSQEVFDQGPPALAAAEYHGSDYAKINWWERIRLGNIGLFGASIYLFILAISLMKSGARAFAPLLGRFFAITTMAKNLGFGWLFAYLIMSGSPVAAAALTFFDAGVIDEFGAFAMITGSRFGACFIVIFIGFIYILRGRDRASSLSMGTLSLAVTISTYLPAFFLGVLILNSGILNTAQLSSATLLTSIFDVVIDPVANLLDAIFPNWAVFLLGIGMISISFNLFDKCLPQVALKESHFGWVSRVIYRPVVMFLLGAFVTMLSMSVSISLSLLIPLSHRGYVRRENVIPYIMGANITTFVDTLLAAVLLNNPAAFSVVLIEMVSVSIISILLLMLFYQPYLHLTLSFTNWVTACNKNLVLFMLTILTIPIVLLFM